MQKFSQKIFHIFAHIFAIFTFIFLTNEVVFAAHPFTDIENNSELSTAVSDLYENGIISNDGSNLFRPNEPMNRDFFVSLVTSVGCQECLTPSVDEIIRYNASPFVDLQKNNPYYYCIAIAHEQNMVQWYNIDNYTGNVSCQNGEKYTSWPFCTENKISRMEAAAILLRRAKLWDENRNSAYFERKENFSDVSDYWYGYAQKAVEFGLITKNTDNSVWQDRYITRGEFAIMASKTLEYTQCQPQTKNQKNTHSSYIEIIDKNSVAIINKTVFTEGEDFSFIPRTESGNWTYSWTAKNDNGDIFTSSKPIFPGNDLPAGKYFIDVKIIDPSSNTPISNPSLTVTILPKNPDNNDKDSDGVPDIDDSCPTIFWPKENKWCPYTDDKDTDSDGTKDKDDKCPTIPGPKENKWCPYETDNDGDNDGDGVKNRDDRCPNTPGPAYNRGCPISTDTLSVSIIPNPSITFIDNPITFTPHITNPTNNLTYSWDFWDGTHTNNPGIQNHPYSNSGIFTVTLTLTDNSTGNTAQSTTIIRITDNRDTDKDGVLDSDDHCPLVKWLKENHGCPPINTTDYGCIIRNIYSGNNTNCLKTDNDTDGDGVKNDDDKCPTVPWPVSNQGCPLDNIPDSDNDGVPDTSDICPRVQGRAEWGGCPFPDIYRDISLNACLLDKLNNTGLITGVPSCNSCPCVSTIDITSKIRDCDIIFPTILSPDKQTIYSRGNFYLVR